MEFWVEKGTDYTFEARPLEEYVTRIGNLLPKLLSDFALQVTLLFCFSFEYFEYYTRKLGTRSPPEVTKNVWICTVNWNIVNIHVHLRNRGNRKPAQRIRRSVCGGAQLQSVVCWSQWRTLVVRRSQFFSISPPAATFVVVSSCGRSRWLFLLHRDLPPYEDAILFPLIHIYLPMNMLIVTFLRKQCRIFHFVACSATGHRRWSKGIFFSLRPICGTLNLFEL